MCDALSDEITGLPYTIAASPRQRIHWVRDPSQIRDSPNLEGQVPQEEGGPVITPGTGFPFRRLLRLAGLRWRFSNPPPRGVCKLSQSSIEYNPLPVA
jgi:hypothetical protein